MTSDYCLIIEDGDPYNKGQRLTLGFQDLVLGRSSSNFVPDIAFTSPYVSRKHAQISSQDNNYLISDLGSTHGTMLNDLTLTPFQPRQLQDGDRITLVKGLVTLSFKLDIDYEKTFLNLPRVFAQDEHSLVVDLAKRQAYVNGEPLSLSGKPLDLLMLLYENKNTAISYEQIKKSLWSERQGDENNVPDVGHDEIGSLVYRLRKNLGEPYGSCLIAVPRYGLVLNLESKK